MQNNDEAELIARSKCEDHTAYAELVNRYKNAVYHHCFAIVRDEDTAEDLAQETFITAYYKLKQYNDDYRLATWLFRIATNKALDHLKHTAREVATDDELIASFATSQPSPETNSERSELRALVAQLEPKYRAVISLYYWQGLSYQEVADALDKPLGTVKGWMSRAKQELREELS